MTAETILRYIHFISIFTIVGTLSVEMTLLKPTMTRRELSRLAKIDGLYGVAALTLVGAGLTLWLGGFGKPTYFYSKNWIFHTKIFMFIVIGVMSIKPTTFFIKKSKGLPDELVDVPKTVFTLLKLELILLAVIPFLAGLMAKSIGYFGK